MSGVQLAYIDTMPELTVLMIHGFPLNGTMWWPQINGLDGIARILAPDMRGFGQSVGESAEATIGQYAEDCLHLLDMLSIREPVVVCGLSMGGYIAFEFYRRYPQLVQGLILTATRAAEDNEQGKISRDKAIEVVLADEGAGLMADMPEKLLSDYHFNNNSQLLSALREMMVGGSVDGLTTALAAMRDRRDSRPTLPKIDVPTLIIHGAEDKIVPLVEAQLMQDAIPECELVVLEQAGHLPNMEQPEAWNAAAAEFLGRLL